MAWFLWKSKFSESIAKKSVCLFRFTLDIHNGKLTTAFFCTVIVVLDDVLFPNSFIIHCVRTFFLFQCNSDWYAIYFLSAINSVDLTLLDFTYMNRGKFRILPHICDGTFCENSLVVHYFFWKLHQRCLAVP